MASGYPFMPKNRSHITYSNHTHSALCMVAIPSVHRGNLLGWGSRMLAATPSLSEGPGQTTTASCANSISIISLFQTFQVSSRGSRSEIMLIGFVKASVTSCVTFFIQTTPLHRRHHQVFRPMAIPNFIFPGIKFGIGKGKTMVRRTWASTGAAYTVSHDSGSS